MIFKDPKRRKLIPPTGPPLQMSLSRSSSPNLSDQQIIVSNPQVWSLRPASGNLVPMAPFLEAVKGVFTGTKRQSNAIVQGKVWASFDATIWVSGLATYRVPSWYGFPIFDSLLFCCFFYSRPLLPNLRP